MTKISLSSQFHRIHKSNVEPVNEEKTEKNIFAKSITAVRNSVISLSTSLSDRFSLHKQTESSATRFHRG
ncbi:type III secretion protein SopE2, partial [Salmonella enterica]|nr:type III secretion protein SopE2 [Salmonella enterica]